ncbi:polyprenyl diphosphate synthase [Candidatus Gromoviella agglomerans]|uniref:polyprenyl diphosphate synthase n=1 Tax=Candidatus Gromoviella agglomerans TaxID=2806609 RepID=UPI001E475D0A|nr:polyprenyl diphosphate synthase [Candidatus Gromoviella agglomerans]UFX98456.1 UDP pyrophosphate synthase [Candidatus Gromoviella agglomerans]
MHIAIIMDGNRRWAKANGASLLTAYRKGVSVLMDIAKYLACRKDVHELTVYAYSLANINRSQMEKEVMSTVFQESLKETREIFVSHDIKVKMIGRKDSLSKDELNHIIELENATYNCQSLILNVCFYYSGQWEIANAVLQLFRNFFENQHLMESYDSYMHECKKNYEQTNVINRNECSESVVPNAISNSLSNKHFSEFKNQNNCYPQFMNIDEIQKYLSEHLLRDVDLCIRPSGEQRLSNFLLWSNAYAEFMYSQTLWPDFSINELNIMIQEFYNRDRRFGI